MKFIKDKKVLVYFPAFFPNKIGGSEIQALKLSEELNLQGYEIVFLTPWRKGMSRIFKHNQFKVYTFYTVLEVLKCIVKPIKSPITLKPQSKVTFDYTRENIIYSNVDLKILDYLIFFDYLISLFFHFLFNQNKVRLLHINTITIIAPIFSIISKIFNKKLLVKDSTMDGILQLHMAPFKNILRANLVSQGNFVAMTKVIYENHIKAGVNGKNISLIPNGVDVSKFESVNFDTDPNLCLFVGNLYQQPAKGIDVLLIAWKIVLQSHPNAKMIIVGSGAVDQYEEYCRTIGISNSINFKGGIDSLQEYKNCSLFILPSRREGMSNSLLEAMANGLAVVATRISGNIDLIIENENGFLVEPNNPVDLANAVNKMLATKNYKFLYGSENQKKIQNAYSISEVSKKYESLYNNIFNS